MKVMQKAFANVYDTIMKNTERKLLSTVRYELLSGLEGTILEIGSGTGINFQYYKKETTVTALEPSEVMHEKSISKTINTNITLHNTTIQEAIDSSLLSPEGYQHIVCTLVLCSVPNYHETIDKIVSLLQPGGTLIILEHVKSKNQIISTAQTLWNPMQNFLADGCNLNRETDEYLRKSSLIVLEEAYIGTHNFYYKAVYKKTPQS